MLCCCPQDKSFLPRFKASAVDRYRAEGKFSPQMQQNIRAVARLRKSSVKAVGQTWAAGNGGGEETGVGRVGGAKDSLETREDIETLEEELFGRDGQALPH